MNKNLLSLSALCIVSHLISAQITIPNNNFENWESGQYGEPIPTGWTTENDVSKAFSTKVSAIQSSDKYSGTYSLLLQNYVLPGFGSQNQDTVIGGFASTKIGIAGKALPQYLTGKIKCNLLAGDKAWVSFGYVVEENGIETASVIGLQSFEGSSNGYITFQIQTNSAYYPSRLSDTLQIEIFSYNAFGKMSVAPQEASYINVDSLGFKGTISNPMVNAGSTITNGDFNVWNYDNGIKMPEGWFLALPLQYVDSNSVGQSTDTENGPYALQFSIDPAGFPSIAYTLFKPSVENSYLNGSVKFDLLPNDTVIVGLTKFSKESALAGPTLDSIIFTGSQLTYTHFSLSLGGKISLGDTVALQILAFHANEFGNLRLDGTSTFLLDAVSLSSMPTGVEDRDLAKETISAFPNPSQNGIFNVSSSGNLKFVRLVDAFGNEMKVDQTQKSNGLLVDLSKYSKGIYFLSVEREGVEKLLKLLY